MPEKITYTVHGRKSWRAGKHKWFADPNVTKRQRRRIYANYIDTRNLRHALALYRKLPIDGRQIDIRTKSGARVLLYGEETIIKKGHRYGS